MVRASAESMLRIESSAFSALPSWRNPSRALMITTPRMTAASSHRPTISFTKPAPSRTKTRILLSWARKRMSGPRFLALRQAIGTVLERRRDASAYIQSRSRVCFQPSDDFDLPGRVPGDGFEARDLARTASDIMRPPLFSPRLMQLSATNCRPLSVAKSS